MFKNLFCNVGKSKAQGTIEYLIIIAIVIVIALVVVGLLSSFLNPAAGVGQSVSKVGNWSNSLALTETSVTPDGNYLIRLANNSGEELTISNVKVGDANASYSQDLFLGNAQNFVIDADDICSVGSGVTKQVTITYYSKNGLRKTERYPADTYFGCENYTVSLLANQCPSTSPDSICVPSADSDLNAKNISSNVSIFGVTGYLGLHSGATKCADWVGAWAESCSTSGIPSNQDAAVDSSRDMFENGRFVASTLADGNKVVEDTWNNLMWWDSHSVSSMDWNSAQLYCSNFSAGGYSNWRLASVAEAFSIFDYGSHYDGVGSGYTCVSQFTDCFGSYVWTSTSLPWSPTGVYRYYPANGSVRTSSKTSFYYARCVRLEN